MAAPTVKEVLLKFGIDASNWKAAILELGKLLEQQQKSAASAQANAKKSLAEQKAAFMEIITGRKQETQELQKQAAQQRLIAATETAKASAAKATTAEFAAQTAQQNALQAAQRAIQAEINTKLQQERLVTAEIARQTAQLRQQAVAQRLAAGGGGGAGGGGRRTGGGGSSGGFMGGLLGAAGSTFAGTLTAGVAAGEMLANVIESLIAKVKQFIEQSGPLQQVRMEFERLANIKGYNAPQFLDQLRASTQNLVNDLNLYRMANLAMQSGLKISQDQIVKLAGATVNLARIQGKDATEAMEALNRTFLTGRAYTLAFVTGIDRTTLSLRNQSKGMDDLTTRQMELDKVYQAIIARNSQVGQAVLTVSDAIREYDVLQNRLLTDLSTGLQKSAGMRIFLEDLGKIFDEMGQKGALFEQIGNDIGAFIGMIGSIAVPVLSFWNAELRTMWEILQLLGQVANLVLEPFSRLVNLFSQGSTSGYSFAQRMSSVAGFFTTIADGFDVILTVLTNIVQLVEYAVNGLSRQIQAFTKFDFSHPIESAKAVQEGLIQGQQKAWDDFVAKAGESWSQLAERVQQRQKELAGGKTPTTAAGAGEFAGEAPEETMQHQQQLLQLRLQLQEAESKAELAAVKDRIQQEKSLNEEAYNSGKLSFTSYMKAKRDLATQDHDARLKEISENVKAQESEQKQMMDLQTKYQQIMLTSIKFRMADPNVSPEEKQTLGSQKAQIEASMSFAQQEASLKTRKAEESGKAEAEAENRSYNSTMATLNREQIAMSDSTAKAKAAAQLEVTKAQIEQEKSMLEDEFKTGNVSVESYFNQRIALASRTYAAEQQEADQWLSTQKINSETSIEYYKKMIDAASQQQKDLTKLSIDEADIRRKAMLDSYDSAQKVLEGQLKVHESTVGAGGQAKAQAEQIPIVQALIALEEKKLQIAQQQLVQYDMINEATHTLNADWVKAAEDQNKSLEALAKYRQQLIQLQDNTKVMVASLQDMSVAMGALSEAFTGKGQAWIKQFEQAFSMMAKRAEELRKTLASIREMRAQRAVGGSQQKTPQEIMAATTASVSGGGEALKTALQSSANEIGKWQNALQSATNALLSTASKLSGGTGSGAVTAAPVSAPAESGPSGEPTASSPTGTFTLSDYGAMNMSANSQDAGAASTGLQAVGQAAAQAAPPLAMLATSAGKASTAAGSGGGGGLMDAFKGLADSIKGGKLNLEEFSKSLSAIAQVAGGLAQAITGQGGPIQAGLAGAQAGAQIGDMTDIPFAGVIGAAIGGIVGIFTGEARKKTEELAQNIVADFNAVMTEISQGTQTLGAGIDIQANTIEQTVNQLSGRKGGRDELNQILPQMEQQLQQLRTQQEQVTKSFDEQLTILNAPDAYQSVLSSVDQIIQKYQDYVNAGGNVANANQFLQQSFQQLVEQGLQQLNQAEQDAVNNALQYNDLLLQQQQLSTNTANQIAEIMGNGVATRQMPVWMQKAAELQNIQQNAQIQQDQLTQEMQTSQFKLQAEQQIFGLATTRVGLESQLVALQDSQTLLDMQRIQALQATVGAFSQAVPTNMTSALTQLGLGGAYVPWTSEASAKPTPPIPTGNTAIDLANQAMYQQQLAYYNQQAGLSNQSLLGAGAPTAGTIASGIGLTLGGTINPTTGLLEPQSNVGSSPIGQDVTSLSQISQQNLTAEQQITTMVNTRVTSETTLVNLKMQEIQADLNRLQQWKSFLGVAGTSGSSMPTIEDLLQNLYQNRGRMGYTGFYGETGNPV